MMATIRLAVLLAFGAAAMAAPQFSAPVEAAKKQPRGKLTAAQKKHFKNLKKDIKAQESRGLAQLKPVKPKYKRAEVELDRAADSATNSRNNLNALKAKLEKARTEDRENHDSKPANAGLSPVTLNAMYKPSNKLRRLENLYSKAEAHHQRGPKARYKAARENYDSLKAQHDDAKKTVDDARARLATRKTNKDAARAENLAEKQRAKAAKKRAKNPMQYAELPVGPAEQPIYDVVDPALMRRSSASSDAGYVVLRASDFARSSTGSDPDTYTFSNIRY